MPPKEIKSCLILSYGPVPTPQYQKIEGGGMRCWGLAKGLCANGIDVTVSINSGFPLDHTQHEGIKLSNWALNTEFAEYINSFDAVIMSYCMGDPSLFVVKNITDNVLLILDMYVPIHIEVSARESSNIEEEYVHYQKDVAGFNKVLKRGDYFVCANTPQKHMYTGILGSLGIINPHSYRIKRLFTVPFGIDENEHINLTASNNPYIQLGIHKESFILLWFGGLYPWFDFKPLISTITDLANKNKKFKFVLVGGKNPFNAHPDFVSQYDLVYSEFKKSGLIDKSVYFIEWTDYKDRGLWYAGADAVVSLNRPGEENIYSWRTRVIDYVWGKIPMLTNGGDPLSDYLIQKGAAIKINTDPKSLTSSLESFQSSNVLLKNANKNLGEVRTEFFWHNITKELSSLISSSKLPYRDERLFEASIGYNPQSSILEGGSMEARLKRYYFKAREKGMKRSLAFAYGILKAKAQHILKGNTSLPKAVLLSHPLDNTGAPLVLLEVAKDMAQVYGASNTYIIAPNAEKHLLKQMRECGYKFFRNAAGVGPRVINTQLNIQPNDFVLMNTVEVHVNYKHFVFGLLERNRLNKAHWFIHEDKPALRLKDKGEVEHIKRLLSSGKLDIFVPSSQTAKEYNKFFNSSKVRAVNLRVQIPNELRSTRPANDFKSIKFTMSGTPSDGRKAQLLFLAALEYFEWKLRKPSIDYRQYSIDMVSIGDDYVSEQIKAVGESLCGKRFVAHPKVPLEVALDIASRCNVTVCSSLNETFALFVAEGMQMGHVILRNQTSGWQEQMRDGKNGYLFNDLDVKDLAEKIEMILSKKMSDEQLAKMGLCSQEIATKFVTANYYKQIFG